MFTPEQVRKYADEIFHDQKFGSRPEQRFKCPIHGGDDTNFAFNLDRGVWTCWSHCGSGGMVQLDQRLNGGDRQEATERLFKKLGIVAKYAAKQMVCTYDYVDASGKLLFQKVRLEPKDFRFRTPSGKSGYTYESPTTDRPLYGLPGVITANIIFICEGEKDADTVNGMGAWEAGPMGIVYGTTPGSCSSWSEDHAPFMAGKRVVIFEDNDQNGRDFVKIVATSVVKYAQSVRIVRFEDQPEKSDLTDFVQTMGKEALLTKIKTAEIFKLKEEEIIPAVIEGLEFAMSGNVETNWLIEGVIQKEGNGIIMGDPKAGKSLATVDMIIHLIAGAPWHGCEIKDPIRVGLITREDAPGLTKKRIQRLLKGNGFNTTYLKDRLWVNSREQTKTFDIRNDHDFETLTRDFRDRKCEIVFFDVFNRIHTLDENDNTQMASVTARLSEFGAVVGCQVALIHHINKDTGNANVFNRLRGAGSLHGWMEWGLAITTTNPDDEKSDWVRRIDFESKETTVDPISFKIVDGPESTKLVQQQTDFSKPVTMFDRKMRSAGIN